MAKVASIACAVLFVAVTASGYPSDESESPTPWSRWTEIDGALVHYIDTAPGSDLPVLLIVPGFLGSYATFEELIGLLRPCLRIIVIDLPGFGFSEVPKGDCGAERLVGTVESLAKNLGIRDISLAGTSIGALVAMRLATDRPDLVARLALLSPFGAAGQAGAADKIERLDILLPLAAAFVRQQRIRREIERHVRNPSVLSPEIFESYCRPFRTREGRRYVVRFIRGIIGDCTFDDCLPLLLQPVLVLAGSEDSLIDSRVLKLLDDRVPSCTIHILEGCGHFVYLDEPLLTAGLLVEFCAAGGP